MPNYQQRRNNRSNSPSQPPLPPRMTGQSGSQNGHFSNASGGAPPRPNVQSPLNVGIPYAVPVAPGYPSPPIIIPAAQISPQIWSNPPSPIPPWLVHPQTRPVGQFCYQYSYQAANYTFYDAVSYMPVYYHDTPSPNYMYYNTQGIPSGNNNPQGFVSANTVAQQGHDGAVTRYQ